MTEGASVMKEYSEFFPHLLSANVDNTSVKTTLAFYSEKDKR